MRRIVTTLVLFLVLMVQGVNGQMLSGSYNVGAGGDYETLKAAFDDLMVKGVSGDVTFLITSDLTEAQNVFLGFDARPHTVTIRPAVGETPVVTFSNATGNSSINGAFVLGATSDDWDNLVTTANIVIDGSNNGTNSRDLTFTTASGAATSNFFRLVGRIEDVTWRNTNMSVQQLSFDVLMVSPLRTNDEDFVPSNLIIENNELSVNPNRTLSRAFNVWGFFNAPETLPEVGIIFRNNIINSTRYGVWLRQFAGNTVIQGNRFFMNETGTGETVNPAAIHIVPDGSTPVLSGATITIDRNQFDELNSARRMKAINIQAQGHYQITNNFITNFNRTGTNTAAAQFYGIHVNVPPSPQTVSANIYHNTILMNNLGGTSPDASWEYRGIMLNSNARSEVHILNNILINNDNSDVSSFAYYQLGSAAALETMDYNLWFGSNINAATNTYLIQHTNSGTFQTLVDFRTNFPAFDANSVSKPVTFVNAAIGDLRLTGVSNGDQDLAGTPLAEVTTDIDGNPRNPNHPYMGAFEGRPLSPMVVIRGSQGWRFMSAPTNQTYATLLDPIWTQGATGSNHEESQQPNVFSFDPTVEENDGYVAIGDLDTEIVPGSGFVIYIFDKDDLDDEDSARWPKVLTLNGTENSGTVNPTIFGGSETFSLVGNPFFSTISFEGFDKNDIADQVFVYSHNFQGPFNQGDDAPAVGGGGWRTWNGTAGSLTDGHIAPFQAFFVKNVEDPTGTPSLSIPESAKVDDLAEFYNLTDESGSIQIAGRINQRQQADSWLSVTDFGSLSQNPSDVPALFPLDYEPFLFMFIENNGRALDIKNLPNELAESISLPLHINGWKPNGSISSPGFIPMEGTIELIWPVFENIPDHWAITLYDAHLGANIDMRESSGYVFQTDVSKQRQSLNYRFGVHTPDLSEKNSSRFIIEINPQATDFIPETELPKVVQLSQNYPNPFNPTTQITYELPQSVDVRLDVFNVMGQRVATLVNGKQNAGTHTISFNATHLASGVYVYRLQAGNTVLSRKMTLVK